MTDNTTHAEGHALNSQIHPLLKQRMLNRASTFSEGAYAPTARPRTSSVLSDLSDTRYSFRSSADNTLRSTDNKNMDAVEAEESNIWHSSPLVFAILPAVAGLFFNNGSAVATDILLLALASMFLNWCVRAPWDWYYAAQKVHLVSQENEIERLQDETIVEEDEENPPDEREPDDHEPMSPERKAEYASEGNNSVEGRPKTAAQAAAEQELARDELWALFTCFLGPLIGAYLLHTIRGQLTRQAEGLVSDYNLTIFVMAAEIRPVSHLIKMKQARMVHLQRIVSPELDPTSRFPRSEAEDLARRIADVEARLNEPAGKLDPRTAEISSCVRQSLQPQLDALNRAVRRYEKRQAAQQMQIEARFGELDLRLKDALSLVAAAARTGQRPGIIAMGLSWVMSFVSYWIHTAEAFMMYPFRVAKSMISGVKSTFVATGRSRGKHIQGKGAEHQISTGRTWSKSNR